MRPDGPRRPRPGFVLGVAVLCVFGVYLGTTISASIDVFPLWVAGRFVGTGEAAHIYTDVLHGLLVRDPDWTRLAAQAGMHDVTAYVQPPWVAWAAGPIAKALPFATFAFLVRCINTAALMGSGCIALRVWAPRADTGLSLSVLVGLLASGPGVALAYFNQTQSLIVFALVLAIAWAERRPRAAGIVLGVAAAVKLTPILLAGYFALSRRRLAALWAIGSVAAIAGLDAVLAGADLNRAFLTDLWELGTSLTLSDSNHAPIKLWYALTDPDRLGTLRVGTARAIALSRAAELALNGLALGSAVVLAGLARRRTGAARDGIDALMLIATVPFAPVAWNHYYVAVLLAACGLLVSPSRWLRLGYPALVVLLSLDVYAVDDTTGLTVCALSNAAALLAAVLIACAARPVRTPAAPPEAAPVGA